MRPPAGINHCGDRRRHGSISHDLFPLSNGLIVDRALANALEHTKNQRKSARNRRTPRPEAAARGRALGRRRCRQRGVARDAGGEVGGAITCELSLATCAAAPLSRLRGKVGMGVPDPSKLWSFPRPAALPTKISKTTPCKVAWCRWRGCFERSATTFDASGKSAALFHHRAIVKRPCYERRPPRKRER
jgi:hypothetical protein